jgi:ABC-type branched-subunit amino acid transport system substrate-binding protein
MLSTKKAPLRAPHTALRLSVAIAGLLAASFSLTGMAAAATKHSSYKIVIVTDLTGTGAPNGIPAADGFEAAIKEINASSGGIDGHKITYNVIDDQSTPAGASAAGQQAVAEHPVAILDGSLSSFLDVREPLYKSSGIPVMATNGEGFGLAQWIYSTSFSPAQGAQSLVGAARVVTGKSLSKTRVAIVSLAAPGSEASLDSEKTLLARQGAVVVNTSLNPEGSPSFAAAAANIVSSHPAVVTSIDSAADTVVEAKALVAAGFKGPIVGYYTGADGVTFQAIDSSQYLATRTVAEATPGTGMYAAAKKFGLLAGTTTPLFGEGWALTYMLEQGLTKCGNSCDTPAAVEHGINSLGSFNVPGGAAPYGNLLVNKITHNIIQYEQLFKWDVASKSVVAYKTPISVGPDDN